MTYEIRIPALGPRVSEVELAHWEVDAGQEVAVGDTLCRLTTLSDNRTEMLTLRKRIQLRRRGFSAVQSDRFHIDLVAREPGTIASVAAAPGQILTIGDCIGHCGSPEDGDGVFAVNGVYLREKQ